MIKWLVLLAAIIAIATLSIRLIGKSRKNMKS
jgi:hypothetical protein